MGVLWTRGVIRLVPEPTSARWSEAGVVDKHHPLLYLGH